MRIRGKLIFKEENGKEKIINYIGSKEVIDEILAMLDLYSRKNADYSQEKKIGTELIMPLEELKMEDYMVG